MSIQHPIVKLNVLARDAANAAEVSAAAGGRVYIGVMVKHFATNDEAAGRVRELQQAGIPVSVGLGGGDPAMWSRVVDVAAQTRPEHVNQVFPAAGYTLGALRAAGSGHTLVNALVTPSGTPGRVRIATGPQSGAYREDLTCDAAAAMLAELGVHSVKLYPIDGTDRLDEVAEMVKASVRQGIALFEPTGGIDARSIGRIVEVCAEHGAQTIVPHIYTSIIDPATGLTRISDIEELIAALPAWAR
ncbi:KDGP aldolase [Saccharibacillus sp. CPCC 101409]|uniref:KDGP aldolase n=1 Tax=Saccharibacillus sp. CPCC 101409 TaxID=3058041 RepID=UPI002673CCF8|nr:KDGP aldolase [Saccharibacillus sp. CPCC 101409]MDO3409779.1 KDGP aldolase [Saccharibacillus sp. CPCC 101409]